MNAELPPLAPPKPFGPLPMFKCQQCGEPRPDAYPNGIAGRGYPPLVCFGCKKCGCTIFTSRTLTVSSGAALTYDDEQMSAYGKACWNAGLEAAAVGHEELPTLAARLRALKLPDPKS